MGVRWDSFSGPPSVPKNTARVRLYGRVTQMSCSDWDVLYYLRKQDPYLSNHHFLLQTGSSFHRRPARAPASGVLATKPCFVVSSVTLRNNSNQHVNFAEMKETDQLPRCLKILVHNEAKSFNFLWCGASRSSLQNLVVVPASLSRSSK